MMKEWATVISWQNGIALLRCEPHSGCGNCHSRRGCGSHLLNELGPETDHQLQVEISQPLEPGQKVEVGISEGSLLRSASLVYLTPLVGLIAGGALFQSLFFNRCIYRSWGYFRRRVRFFTGTKTGNQN